MHEFIRENLCVIRVDSCQTMKQFNRITIEQYNHRTGVTLLELLIAISLLVVIVLGFSSIDLFSRYHVMSSDRRAKLQNDASYVLEHMAKNIGQGIGDINNSTVDPSDIVSDTAIKVWVDGNPYASPAVSPNGRRDAYPDDRQIAYRYRTTGSEQYQFWYYAVCRGPNCNQSGSTSPEVLSSKITNFTRTPADNYVYIQVTARWQPDQAASVDNPEITLRNRINMPAVSTH